MPWLWSENVPLAASGKIKKVLASKLAEWVSEPWKKILEIIEKNFLKTCCDIHAVNVPIKDIIL